MERGNETAKSAFVNTFCRNRRRFALREFLNDLREQQNDPNKESGKQITQCVFLGALCLKPVPDIFQVTLQPIKLTTATVNRRYQTRDLPKKHSRKNSRKTVNPSNISNHSSRILELFTDTKPRENAALLLKKNTLKMDVQTKQLPLVLPAKNPLIIDLEAPIKNGIQKLEPILVEVDDDEIEDYLEVDPNVVADLEALIPEEEIEFISNSFMKESTPPPNDTKSKCDEIIKINDIKVDEIDETKVNENIEIIAINESDNKKPRKQKSKLKNNSTKNLRKITEYLTPKPKEKPSEIILIDDESSKSLSIDIPEEKRDEIVEIRTLRSGVKVSPPAKPKRSQIPKVIPVENSKKNGENLSEIETKQEQILEHQHEINDSTTENLEETTTVQNVEEKLQIPTIIIDDNVKEETINETIEEEAVKSVEKIENINKEIKKSLNMIEEILKKQRESKETTKNGAKKGKTTNNKSLKRKRINEVKENNSRAKNVETSTNQNEIPKTSNGKLEEMNYGEETELETTKNNKKSRVSKRKTSKKKQDSNETNEIEVKQQFSNEESNSPRNFVEMNENFNNNDSSELKTKDSSEISPTKRRKSEEMPHSPTEFSVLSLQNNYPDYAMQNADLLDSEMELSSAFFDDNKESYRRVYKCRVCLTIFETYNRLKAHRKIHEVKNPYQCTVCPESYNDVEELAAHLRIHKGKMPYPCKKCDSSFWTAVQLERHQLVHVLKKVPPPNSSAPKRIFKCEECGKEFKKICDLERHTRVHTGEKPSVCNICNKRFQQAYNLNKHLLIHTQEKNYECIICQKKFGRNDVLNRHVLTHSIDKPFHCSICSKTFIRNTQLNLHIRKHHGSKNDPKNDDSVAAGTSSD